MNNTSFTFFGDLVDFGVANKGKAFRFANQIALLDLIHTQPERAIAAFCIMHIYANRFSLNIVPPEMI